MFEKLLKSLKRKKRPPLYIDDIYKDVPTDDDIKQLVISFLKFKEKLNSMTNISKTLQRWLKLEIHFDFYRSSTLPSSSSQPTDTDIELKKSWNVTRKLKRFFGRLTKPHNQSEFINFLPRNEYDIINRSFQTFKANVLFTLTKIKGSKLKNKVKSWLRYKLYDDLQNTNKSAFVDLTTSISEKTFLKDDLSNYPPAIVLSCAPYKIGNIEIQGTYTYLWSRSDGGKWNTFTERPVQFRYKKDIADNSDDVEAVEIYIIVRGEKVEITCSIFRDYDEKPVKDNILFKHDSYLNQIFPLHLDSVQNPDMKTLTHISFEIPKDDVSDIITDRSESLKILIDEITFTLLKRGKHNDNEVVHIESELKDGHKTKFWVYRSTSELGVWRYCKDIGTGQLNKGNDYVQATCVHFELQNHINTNLSSLKFQIKKEHCMCDVAWRDSRDDYNVNCNQIDQVVSNEDRKSCQFVEPFNSMRDHLCGEDRDMSLALKKEYYDKCSASFEDIYKIESIKRVVKNYSFSLQDVINTQSSIWEITLSRKTQLEGEDNDANTIKMFCVASEFFKGQNRLYERPEYRKQFVTSLSAANNFHICPCLVTTLEGLKISQYGIYSKFIPCGMYVCKLFDYITQCSVEETSLQQCTTKYAYIGNRYRELFPNKELLELLTNSLKYGGGCRLKYPKRQKKHRSRKPNENAKKKNI